MASLYELTNEYLEAMSKIEEMDLDPELVKDTLDSLQSPIEEKAENIIKYMKNLEADEKALKEESTRLKEKADYVKKKREQLKNYLDYNLQAAGIKELRAGLFEVKYRKGSEVVEVDEEKLDYAHLEYLQSNYSLASNIVQYQKPKVSKTALKKLLKTDSSIEVPGVVIKRNPDGLVIK